MKIEGKTCFRAEGAFRKISHRTVVRFWAVTRYISLSISPDKVAYALWATFWDREQPSSDLWSKLAYCTPPELSEKYRVCMRATKSCLPNRPIKKATDIRICSGFEPWFGSNFLSFASYALRIYDNFQSELLKKSNSQNPRQIFSCLL